MTVVLSQIHKGDKDMRLKRNLRAGAWIVACAAALSTPAMAQGAWPDKPVTLVVPYSAGGPTDVVARMLAIPMGKSLGQTVIVENTVGAGGTIAATRVARAAPNGYTILIHHMGMATAPALYKKLPYDPLKDFEYIGQVMDVPMTLLSRKDFPAKNFQELLTYVKANKEKVSIGNAGIGAVSQLCGMLFINQIGVKLTEVPYKGAGPALNDLMGGQVDLLCDQTTQTAPVIKDGNRVKVYGVTTLKRLSTMPDLPTLDEQGLKGFDVKVWHGVYAPKNTPPDALAKLNAALRAALQDDHVKKRLAELSSEIVSPDKVTPEGLRKHLEAETVKWGKVIRAAGVQAE
ncbi:MAG: tripartite tricarboxylate transporter substrate binding protein BugD [Variovorax sp.]